MIIKGKEASDSRGRKGTMGIGWGAHGEAWSGRGRRKVTWLYFYQDTYQIKGSGSLWSCLESNLGF